MGKLTKAKVIIFDVTCIIFIVIEVILNFIKVNKPKRLISYF